MDKLLVELMSLSLDNCHIIVGYKKDVSICKSIYDKGFSSYRTQAGMYTVVTGECDV